MITKINKSLNSIPGSMSAVCFKVAIHHKKSRAILFPGATRLPLQFPGNPAISLRPVAFRPLLTKGLALSRENLITFLKFHPYVSKPYAKVRRVNKIIR